MEGVPSMEVWLSSETYLPAQRLLFDPDTAELRRDAVPALPFTARSADAFDLATTTVALLERMYAALTRLWADSHPLLDHRVTMLNLQTQYRAFHQYSIQAIRDLLVKPAVAPVPANDKQQASLRSVRNLQQTLRQDREREQHYAHLADQLERELRVIERQTDDLLRSLSSRNEAGKYRYLERLAEAKEQRTRVLAQAVAELEQTRVPANYNRQFEQRLLDTLNQSIAAVAGLRTAVDVAPTLFQGMTPRAQLQVVLPHMTNAQLPQALLGLYQELYLNLSETSVRNLLERRFGSQSGATDEDLEAGA